MERPALSDILKTALYIGTVGYGGPAILALMKRVIVHEKRWISEEEFMNALSLSQILPGATGVTLLGYVGQKLRGGWGGILMPFAFAFPAMAAITVLAWAYFKFGDLKFVHSIFMGLGAMVVALLVSATLMMGRSVFRGMDRNAFKGIAIAALSFLGILYLHWNVVYVILVSGALGALFFTAAQPPYRERHRSTRMQRSPFRRRPGGETFCRRRFWRSCSSSPSGWSTGRGPSFRPSSRSARLPSAAALPPFPSFRASSSTGCTGSI